MYGVACSGSRALRPDTATTQFTSPLGQKFSRPEVYGMVCMAPRHSLKHVVAALGALHEHRRNYRYRKSGESSCGPGCSANDEYQCLGALTWRKNLSPDECTPQWF